MFQARPIWPIVVDYESDIEFIGVYGNLYTNAGNSKHDAPSTLIAPTLYSFQCHGAWLIEVKHQTAL
jgi:hypothetical protein